MIEYPNKIRKEQICTSDNIQVITDCYCPNGHSLVNSQANFSGFAGIVLKIETQADWGTIAISPISHDKRSILLGTNCEKGDSIGFFCPHCDIKIPVYTKCYCGGDIVALFLDQETNFCDCIGFCDNYGCNNAEIIEDMVFASKTRTTKMAQTR